MAKHPDPRTPKPQPHDSDVLPAEEALDVEENVEVLDADLGTVEATPVPKTDTVKKIDPDRPVAPSPLPHFLSSDDTTPVLPSYVQRHPEDTSAVPNFSLEDIAPPTAASSYLSTSEPYDVFADEPAPAQVASGASSVIEAAEAVEPADIVEPASKVEHAEVVEEAHEVFAGEPAPDGSSVVEVTELADDVSEDVLSGEFAHEKDGSSVISASVTEMDVLAEEASDAVEAVSDVVEALPASDVVLGEDDIITAQEASEVKALATTPPPLKDDDVLDADILDAEEVEKGPESDFVDEVVEDAEPIPVAKPVQKNKSAKAKTDEEDAVDLGSDPDLLIDAAEAKPADAKASLENEEDINWDDIDALAGSKVEKKPGDGDQTLAVEGGSDAKRHAAQADDVLSEMDTIADMASPLMTGAKAMHKEPSSEIESVDDVLDSDFEDEGKPAPKSQFLEADEATELDTPAVMDDDLDVVDFDDDKPAKTKGKKGHEDDEAELVGAGAGTGKPAAKAKKGGGMLVGMLLSLLLLAGGAAAVWYLKPDILEDVAKISPNAPVPTVKKGPTKAADGSQLNKVQAELTKAQDELKSAQEEKSKTEAKLQAELAAKEELQNIADKAQLAKIEAEKNVAKALKGQGDNKAMDAVNKLLQGAKIAAPGDKGVEQLISSKKAVEDKLDAMNKILATENLEGGGPEALQSVIAARNKLLADRDDLDKAIKTAYQELAKGGLVPPNDDPRGKIVDAAKLAAGKAESPPALKFLEKAFDFSALASELNAFKAREPFVAGPDWKMEAYITRIKELSRSEKFDLAPALKEANWILGKDSNSPAVAKLKALVVLGLAERVQEKFVEARKTLEMAVKEGAAHADAPWMKPALSALKELSAPTAYYLPQGQRLEAQGNLQEALEVLTLGLKAFPGYPALLNRRAIVRLELTQGNKAALILAQKEIREDAENAAKNPGTSADAAFILGQLEEQLGNLEQAENEFRKAIKSHRGHPEVANRYVIALARILQRDQTSAPPQIIPLLEAPAEPVRQFEEVVPKNVEPKKDEAEPKKDDIERKKDDVDPKKDDVDPKKDDADPKKDDDLKKDNAKLEFYRNLVLYALVGVQAPGQDDEMDPRAAARIDESIELAKKLLESADPQIKGQGYMILGLALSKKGKRTDGLKEYVKGLELMYPTAAEPKQLAKLLDEHPAFQQPDAQSASPSLADQFYSKGLQQYWARNYPEAETQFRKAILYYNQDARYFYFLGMSLSAQKGTLKRDAATFAFEQAARLEAANRPSLTEVNASLERVQGPVRALVDSFRTKNPK
jgi:Tetratricopeptide repeat